MDDLSAQRTLVKSPPELWAEISDVESLARHLGEFGDIRITEARPETTVAWEGDRIRGTVSLEPAGWGTKVTLAAELTAVEAIVAETEAAAVVEVEPEAEPEPVAAAEPVAEPVVAVEPEPEPIAEVATEPTPEVEAAAAPDPAPRGRFFARLFGKHRPAPPTLEIPPAPAPEPAPEPDPVPEPAPDPIPEPQPDPIPEPSEPNPGPVVPDTVPEIRAEPVLDADGAQAVLVGMLDDLGSAHHRPFSRG